MKTYIYILFLSICSISISAQKKMNAKNYEKIKTLKVNYISSELNLSPELAEVFWPIYNQYEKENRELRSIKIRNIKVEIEQNGSIDNMSDKMALELSKKFLKISESYFENRKSTFKKLEKILPPQQLLKLNFVEMDFNQKVLRKLQRENSKK